MTILMKIFSSPNDYRAVSNQTFRANTVRRPLRSKWLPLDLKKGEEIVVGDLGEVAGANQNGLIEN